jgi:hypothetical protein
MICSIKYFFFKEILYTCPFLIATVFGSYHRFLDSGMLLTSKLLKKGFHVASLKSSLHLCHKWPQQCSVCRSGAIKFSRLFPCYDVAIISMNNRISIRVMFYLLHLYLFSDTAVQRDLMWCRICQPFRRTPSFKWGSCWMIVSFLYNVLWIVIRPFVIFRFSFVLSVLWFTASDYPYGIIKLFSLKHVMFSVEENKQRFNINNNIL